MSTPQLFYTGSVVSRWPTPWSVEDLGNDAANVRAANGIAVACHFYRPLAEFIVRKVNNDASSPTSKKPL